MVPLRGPSMGLPVPLLPSQGGCRVHPYGRGGASPRPHSLIYTDAPDFAMMVPSWPGAAPRATPQGPPLQMGDASALAHHAWRRAAGHASGP